MLRLDLFGKFLFFGLFKLNRSSAKDFLGLVNHISHQIEKTSEIHEEVQGFIISVRDGILQPIFRKPHCDRLQEPFCC